MLLFGSCPNGIRVLRRKVERAVRVVLIDAGGAMKANLKFLGVGIGSATLAASAGAAEPAAAVAPSQGDLLFHAFLVVAILYCLNIVIRFVLQLGRGVSPASSSAPQDDVSTIGSNAGRPSKASAGLSSTSVASLSQASGSASRGRTQGEEATIGDRALT
jgi:tetrahydromethanopterin S-methyltransferase subunit D